MLCEAERFNALVFLGKSPGGCDRMLWYCSARGDDPRPVGVVTGARSIPLLQVGGRDGVHPEVLPEMPQVREWMPHALDDTRAPRPQRDMARAPRRESASPAETRSARQIGPNLRASGVDWNCGATKPLPRIRPGGLSVRCMRATCTTGTAANGREWRSRHASSTSACAARADGGQAVDRRRPQGRLAAARGAATRRWSRSATNSKIVTKASAFPRARSTSRSSRRAASRLPRPDGRPEACARALQRHRRSRTRGDARRARGGTEAMVRPDLDRRLADT